jgi:hypothetical protein
VIAFFIVAMTTPSRFLLCTLILCMLVFAGQAIAANPILVITKTTSPFTTYLPEILRAEGMNAFDVAEVSDVTSGQLSGYSVAMVGEMPLTSGEVSMFTTWVNAGGTLIAMRPDSQLNALFGLAGPSGTMQNAYLQVNTSNPAGHGIVADTIQYHGTADLYALNGATAIATLYSNSTTATSSPAVSSHAVGSGIAIAFTYDLARSVVYTRQGNPAWSGQLRDGVTPIRPHNLFFGASASDPQPDWVDLTKVAIPQADEQQRLLINIILNLNASGQPIPRFWYLPKGLKAALVMTGDDHGTGGTEPRFDQFIAASPANCSVADWECIRSTSYVYPTTPLANPLGYASSGFEIGLHVFTECEDYPDFSVLDFLYGDQLSEFAISYPQLAAPTTSRTHCVAWSDYDTQPQVELNRGIRLDTNYYYYPSSWVNDRPGLFTGSGMPMRFMTAAGSLVNVYQATTQMTDESGQTFPNTFNQLLSNALGPQGYYGVFTANMHTDLNNTNGQIWSGQMVSAAQAAGIPVVSAAQMLEWLDGRNDSSFATGTWQDSTLQFDITVGTGARNIQAMLPANAGSAGLGTIDREGQPVNFTLKTIKGVEYAMFPATAGSYKATYSGSLSYSITGTITPASLAAGSTVTITGPTTTSTSIDEYGVFNFVGLSAGTYTVAPSVSAGMFTPANRTVTVGPNADGASFTIIEPIAIATASLPEGTQGVAYSTTLTATGGTSPYNWTIESGSLPAGIGLNSSTGVIAGTPTASGTLNVTFRVTDSGAVPQTVTKPLSVTIVAAAICPCTIWPSSTTPETVDVGTDNPVELGVKFKADVNGYITALRFYKSEANTGTHIGNLWSIDGTKLATVTFAGETASGWQQANLATPVAVTANTVYVASYHSSNGHFAADAWYFENAFDNAPLHALANGVSGPNGVFAYDETSVFPEDTFISSNYWVDVVLSTTPISTFSVSGTVSGSSVAGVTVKLTGGSIATTTTNATGMFTFNGLLNGSYTVTPSKPGYTFAPTSRGVTVSNADISGVDFTSSPIVIGSNCPCSIWDLNTVPGLASANDPNAIELGVRFRSDFDGVITGIRFYKGVSNTGTHIGNLWTNDGTLLGTAVFANETASGWQEVTFAQPIFIQANVTYVASYHTDAGFYAADDHYFDLPFDNVPLHALQNGTDGPNGVFSYGPSGFPTDSFQNRNYWVDVVFDPIFTVSGTINGPGGALTTVWLTGSATWSTITDASGHYAFVGITDGSYTVTPSKPGYKFVPGNRTVNVSGGSQTNVDFDSAVQLWSINGTIGGAGGNGATVTLSGDENLSTTADASGNFSFSGLANGDYTVTPTNAGFDFSPISQDVTITGASVSDINFTSASHFHSITGTISGSGGNGATVTLNGPSIATTSTDASGNYAFTGIVNGSYTVTPNKTLYQFTPISQNVTVSDASLTGVDFSSDVAPFHDDFNRGSIGSNYALINGGDYAVPTLNGATFITSDQSKWSVALVLSSAAVIDSNQFARVTAVNASKTGYSSLFVRATLTANMSDLLSGYELDFGRLPDDSGDWWGVYYKDPVTGWHTLQEYYATPSAIPIPTGTVVELHVSGNTLQVLINGQVAWTGIHSGGLSGTPGLGVYGDSQLDEFYAGNFSPITTYSITGTISGAGGNGATITLSGAASGTITADAAGNYVIAGAPDGSYTVTASKANYIFAPASQNLVVNGTAVTGVDFSSVSDAAQAPLAVSVTPSSGSGTSQTFQFAYSDPNGYADIALVQMVINSPA